MALYNAGVSATASRVIVIAGALMQPHWVPPAELRSRLARLSTLTDLSAQPGMMPASDAILPRELAHDRWLRQQAGLEAAQVLPGAMSAVRRLAPRHESLAGWLLEPVHFHLAKDHVVLVDGAAQDLAPAQAQQLADAILPLLVEDGFSLTVVAPTLWLLSPDPPLKIECASPEAAAGRNVDGYLPSGPDARRYRRLLNEIR